MRNIFFVFMIMILVGCKETVTEKITSSDSLGFTKSTYVNDVLKTESQYAKNRNGQETLNGVYIEHYPSGKIKKKCEYNNGLLSGPSEEYFENGQLLRKGFNVNGKAIGETIEYFSDGKIASIILSTQVNPKQFYLKYNHSGQITKLYGLPLYANAKKNPIQLNEQFKMAIEVIVLKGYETELDFKLYTADGEVLEANQKKFSKPNFGMYVLNHYFKEVGKYPFIARVSCKDLSGNILIQNELKDTIVVIN